MISKTAKHNRRCMTCCAQKRLRRNGCAETAAQKRLRRSGCAETAARKWLCTNIAANGSVCIRKNTTTPILKQFTLQSRTLLDGNIARRNTMLTTPVGINAVKKRNIQSRHTTTNNTCLQFTVEEKCVEEKVCRISGLWTGAQCENLPQKWPMPLPNTLSNLEDSRTLKDGRSRSKIFGRSRHQVWVSDIEFGDCRRKVGLSPRVSVAAADSTYTHTHTQPPHHRHAHTTRA